jgi:leishmanolysin-like peptidase
MMNNREDDQLIMIFTHEVAHSLGFAKSHMQNYLKPDGTKYAEEELFVTREYRGIQNLMFLKTPNVLARARIAFDCQELPGLQLENQGNSTSAASHWESRIMRNEFMNPQMVPHNAVYSDLTLALFEDSGWYKPDYNYSTSITWGYQQGCDFHEKKCINSKYNAEFEEFCTDSEAESRCSSNYLDKGICFMREYDTDISTEYRYFKDKKLGGNLYTDYCPIVTGTTNCRTLRLGNKEYGEEFCEECRCIEGTYSKSKELPHIQGTCHRIDCIDGNVYITIGVVSVKCGTTGEWVKVKGFQGKLKCPDIKKICREPPCSNNCYGEKCYNGSCTMMISKAKVFAVAWLLIGLVN